MFSGSECFSCSIIIVVFLFVLNLFSRWGMLVVRCIVDFFVVLVVFVWVFFLCLFFVLGDRLSLMVEVRILRMMVFLLFLGVMVVLKVVLLELFLDVLDLDFDFVLVVWL